MIGAMTRNRTQEDLRRMEDHYRKTGYDDGYLGRPAKSRNITYQQAWRRGREQRERDAQS